jgi:hypothetical protein
MFLKKMQVHHYVGKYIVTYRSSDIGFMAIYIAVRIGGYLINDGLSIVVLTSRVVGGPSFVSVSTTSTSVNTMNNMSPIVASTNQKNTFVQVQNIGGSVIDLEDTIGRTCSKRVA